MIQRSHYGSIRWKSARLGSSRDPTWAKPGVCREKKWARVVCGHGELEEGSWRQEEARSDCQLSGKGAHGCSKAEMADYPYQPV